mgnify:CR=1 FL=1
MGGKLFVCIMAYNEEKNIGRVIADVSASGMASALIPAERSDAASSSVDTPSCPLANVSGSELSGCPIAAYNGWLTVEAPTGRSCRCPAAAAH